MRGGNVGNPSSIALTLPPPTIRSQFYVQGYSENGTISPHPRHRLWQVGSHGPEYHCIIETRD